METLDGIKRTLIDEFPKSFEDCVRWARLHWEEQFSNQIKQLLYNFPPDQVDETKLVFMSFMYSRV